MLPVETFEILCRKGSQLTAPGRNRKCVAVVFLSLRDLAGAVVLLLTTVLVLTFPGQAAQLDIAIDISEQSIEVRLDDQIDHQWQVSTARPGYSTPIGVFQPIRLERMWYSTKYNNAPMPHSIFFYGGYAIHGTTEIASLGVPASHGCIRLHPEHAKELFNLVKHVGNRDTVIRITP